ncbi:DMT family transporter [Hydromonas duriensis]|uniref:Drug/metabolite transporter (DMT)-like permease n=1 Tax=Hydromonas duriensis TaxID=1527608 RepID=A0A4R6Y6V2_9BURK|nr:DMT family transporter [Hydromonas duriensis]TDR28848.1 drug/metabolite transporter (DMT)-like permease [Hydromonas duriensis]
MNFNQHNTISRGIFAGIGAGALWGLVFLSPQVTYQFSPLSQMVVRYLCYGFFAITLSLRTIFPLIKQLTKQDWQRLVVLSLQGNIVYYMFLATGVKYAGIAPTTLIIGVLPLTITLMGRHEHDSLPIKKLLAPSLMIIAGIAAISLDVFLHSSETLTSTPLQRALALACAAGALACWTFYAYQNAQYLRAHAHVGASDWSNLTGVVTALLAIVMLAIGYLVSLFQPDSLLALNTNPSLDWLTFILFGGFGVAFFASWLGNMLWNKASQALPISLSAQLIVSESLFSLLYGFLYDARWPRALEWLAIALALSGVLWAIRLHVKADPSDANIEMH